MLAKFDPGAGHKFFYTDHLGSTRLVGGSSETSDDMRRDYYPYGEELTAAGNDDTPYTFVGKELDSATGLHYFGARYYDPRIGRWYVPDALADRYLAWSPYNYGLANPLSNFDPDGNQILEVLKGVAFASRLVANLTNVKRTGDMPYQQFLQIHRGKSLRELQTETDPERYFLSAGGPNPSVRFIEDPAFPQRSIDMRHFLVIGQMGANFSSKPEAGIIFGNLFGIATELQQAIRGYFGNESAMGSAFAGEDFYSNYLGSLFFAYFYEPHSASIDERLSDFFEWWVQHNLQLTEVEASDLR